MQCPKLLELPCDGGYDMAAACTIKGISMRAVCLKGQMPIRTDCSIQNVPKPSGVSLQGCLAEHTSACCDPALLYSPTLMQEHSQVASHCVSSCSRPALHRRSAPADASTTLCTWNCPHCTPNLPFPRHYWVPCHAQDPARVRAAWRVAQAMPWLPAQ